MKRQTERPMVAAKRKRACRYCRTYRGVIRKYGLMICRRCFVEQAGALGFKKYE